MHHGLVPNQSAGQYAMEVGTLQLCTLSVDQSPCNAVTKQRGLDHRARNCL